MVKADTLTIASGATASDVLDLKCRSVIGFRFPTMTGTAVTMKEGPNASSLTVLGDENAGFSIASPSTRDVRFASPILGVCFFQVVSGSAEAADRSITVLTDDFTA